MDFLGVRHRLMAGLVSEDPVLAGCGHRLEAAPHVQLGVDVVDVCFHRAQANDQSVGDLLIRGPYGDEVEYLQLAPSQAARGCRGGHGPLSSSLHVLANSVDF